MFVEKYFTLISKDIEEGKKALQAQLPPTVRAGLLDEMRTLQDLASVLHHENRKSPLHTLRARLRWRREDLKGERNQERRKTIEKEIESIEQEIADLASVETSVKKQR